MREALAWGLLNAEGFEFRDALVCRPSDPEHTCLICRVGVGTGLEERFDVIDVAFPSCC